MAVSQKKLKATLDRYNQLIKRNSHDDSIREIALEEGRKVSTIERRLRKARAEDNMTATEVMEIMEKLCDPSNYMGPVLIMPDIHAPYHHPDTIEFLQWVHSHRGCRERVVNVGDLMDFHAMSRHPTETDALSPKEEYARAKEFVAELTEVFPYGDLVLGNHDQIPQRQCGSINVSTDVLKDDHELYNLPDGWNIHPHYHVIEDFDVLVEHGINSSGKYGCANTRDAKRTSYVQGHIHSAAGVLYSSNHVETLFGMNVGCLVDSGSLAMRYGKYSARKGCLGCGVVYSGSHAEFIPMSSWPGFKGEA